MPATSVLYPTRRVLPPPVSKATVLTTPRVRAMPRTSSISPTMADFSGMVTESPRQPSSSRTLAMKSGKESSVTSMAE
jgi:hypothetical protein